MPAEMTAKKPVTRRRTVFNIEKKKIRDPRFDDISGEYHEDNYKINYSFLNQMREDEINDMKMQLKKTKDAERKEKIKKAITIMQQRKISEHQQDEKKKIVREWKKKENERVSKGKNPFYLSKTGIRDLQLKSKFKELQSQGKVDKYIARKRKKVQRKHERNFE